MLRSISYFVFLYCSTVSLSFSSELKFIHYDGFQIVVDCETRSPIRFSYVLGEDVGSLKRRSSFSLDPDFPKKCQQLSGKSYKSSVESFDRGHLVPANHLDSRKLGIHQSNFVTNILPQAKNMNRGAWLATEEIIECARETNIVYVYGGALYNRDRTRDHFKKSHGIKTPSAFWKVVITKGKHIAWIIPNRSEAKRPRLDDYIVSISVIERKTGEKFQFIPKNEKNIPASVSWEIPKSCDRS